MNAERLGVAVRAALDMLEVADGLAGREPYPSWAPPRSAMYGRALDLLRKLVPDLQSMVEGARGLAADAPLAADVESLIDRLLRHAALMLESCDHVASYPAGPLGAWKSTCFSTMEGARALLEGDSHTVIDA